MYGYYKYKLLLFILLVLIGGLEHISHGYEEITVQMTKIWKYVKQYVIRQLQPRRKIDCYHLLKWSKSEAPSIPNVGKSVEQ